MSTEQLQLAIAIVGGITVLTILWTLVLARRLRRLNRLMGAERRSAGLAKRADRLSEVHLGGFANRLMTVERSHKDLESRGRLTLQQFALVRFNAFQDMGGELSFSAAILDDYGDGLVITSINGRTESRTYAKTVKNMQSQQNLSNEEREALSRAASRAGRKSAENAFSG